MEVAVVQTENQVIFHLADCPAVGAIFLSSVRVTKSCTNFSLQNEVAVYVEIRLLLGIFYRKCLIIDKDARKID